MDLRRTMRAGGRPRPHSDGTAPAAAVPALIELLQRRKAVPGAREEAAEALGRIGEPAADIVPALIAALKDENAVVRQQAAQRWAGSVRRPCGDAGPACRAEDDKEKVAAMACWSLGLLGGKGVAPALLEVLQGGRDGPADMAGQALWQMGPAAKEVVPALVTLLSKPPKETGRIRTLLVLLGPIAVPDLAAALVKAEATVQQAAAEVLGQMGPVVREAVPALAKNLLDKPLPIKLAAPWPWPRSIPPDKTPFRCWPTSRQQSRPRRAGGPGDQALKTRRRHSSRP